MHSCHFDCLRYNYNTDVEQSEKISTYFKNTGGTYTIAEKAWETRNLELLDDLLRNNISIDINSLWEIKKLSFR